MKELLINASRSYAVRIQGDTDGFMPFIKPLFKGDKMALLTDERVFSLYGEAVCRLLSGYRVTKIVLPVGEKQKNAENYLKILQTLAENGFTRSDAVLTLGGGVVGDLGGFAASTYMRGIAWLYMPTTVLAAVDACVGGKTAIDLPSGKNLCGSFYPPSGVYVNTAFFRSLSERELLSGYGEIVKYALLSDEITEKDLEKDVDETLVYQCLQIKKRIVEADEKESGERKLLNLGHTVGHAVELLSDYTLSHGECVVKGLYAALKLSERIFGLDEEKKEEILKTIAKKGHDLTIPYTGKELVGIIKSDKKRAGKTVDVVLLRGVSRPEIVRLTLRQIEEGLA